MRLVKYIDEARKLTGTSSKIKFKDKELNFDDMMTMLRKDCKPFLKENKGGELLWRGGYTIFDGTYTIHTARKDRKPVDTTISVHNYIDKLFKAYHGWKARSEGVFATPSYKSTIRFGDPAIFFPIGRFQYLWEPQIKDLTTTLCKIFHLCGVDHENERTLKDPNVQKKLSNIIKSYNNKRLKVAASDFDNEIMFQCKKYYMVHRNHFNHLQELLD